MTKKSYPAVTTSQLAQICGVSQGTVDRALHNRPGICAATRDRVLRAAAEYGYVPNIHARVLSGGCSMLLGVVVFDLNNDYFSRLVMELEKLCHAEGYSSVLMFSHNSADLEIDCLNQLAHIGVDGIVLCPVGQGEAYRCFLKSMHMPIVTVGNRIPEFPFSGFDDYAAMTELTRRVTARGYHTLLYFAPVLQKRGMENIDAQEQRYAGFASETKKSGTETRLVLNEMELSSRIDAVQRAAVICPSDIYALRVRNLLQKQKKTGIGLCGFDDSRLLEQCGIALTSVGCDYCIVAKEAFDCVIHGQMPAIVPFYVADRGTF